MSIAGIGAWFSLVFKNSFALVGLGCVPTVFAPLSQSAVVYVAVTLGARVIALNTSRTKVSGQIQAVSVTVVVASLLAYVVNAWPSPNSRW